MFIFKYHLTLIHMLVRTFDNVPELIAVIVNGHSNRCRVTFVRFFFFIIITLLILCVNVFEQLITILVILFCQY